MKTDVKINVHIISAVIQAVHNRGLLPDPSPRVPKCFRVSGQGPYTPGQISARVIRQRFSTCFLCSHPSDFR